MAGGIDLFFRLNPECYFVRGERCGAIFDLIEGEIFALDELETQVVSSFEGNNPVREDDDFVRDLRRHCLGNFYPLPVYIQKLRVGSPIYEDQINEPPSLHRGFIEINNSCDRDCWFCGFHGIKRSCGCMGCNKWNESGDALSVKSWKMLVEDLRDLGCSELFITGGDLTSVWEKAMEILDHAQGNFSEIYLILHHHSTSDEIRKDLKGKATAIVQTEDQATAQFDGFMPLLIADASEGKYTNWTEVDNSKVDFVIRDQNLIAKDLPLLSDKKMSAELHSFINNMRYHPCLGHTISISFNGMVLPCPMMRAHIFGNATTSPLFSIFQEKKIDEFWKLTLDELERCKSCEYRYACADCRSLEESLTGDLKGKRLCNYNPIEGKWL